MRMCRIWLTALVLACGGAVAGCATADGQGGDHGPHGVYVSGAGGYGVH